MFYHISLKHNILFNTLKITFYGAAGRVTGSKHLITTHQHENILLDCGMFQGEGEEGDYLNRHFHFDPTTIHYVVLSHAHIDHIGLLPKLVKEGYQGPIFCNPSTADLCNLMLYDSAHIQEKDLERINRYREKDNLPLVEALYTEEDVAKVLKLIEPRDNNHSFLIGMNTKCMFTPNAHILGSVAVNLELNAEGRKVNLTYTGDIGRPNDKILKGPSPFPQADYIICESTYGDRDHPDAKDGVNHLRQLVMETCIEKNGKIIIPAFSIDRTQEIVYMLDRLVSEQKIPPVKTYVDSPLSVKATHIMNLHRNEFNGDILDYITRDGDPFDFKGLHYVQNVEESKKINDEDIGSIIISASGMAEAGRVKHHIANNIGDPKNLILLVGYATPMSLAGKLKNGASQVRIFGQYYDVKARIESMPYFSAHADKNEMLDYLSCQNKEKVREIFLVHGDEEALAGWKEQLTNNGFNKVTVAQMKMEVAL